MPSPFFLLAGRDTVGISGYGEIEPTLLNQMDQYGNWTGPVAHSVAPHPGQRPPYMPRQQDGPSGQGGSTPGGLLKIGCCLLFHHVGDIPFRCVVSFRIH
jgi:hypothetical protein